MLGAPEPTLVPRSTLPPRRALRRCTGRQRAGRPCEIRQGRSRMATKGEAGEQRTEETPPGWSSGSGRGGHTGTHSPAVTDVTDVTDPRDNQRGQEAEGFLVTHFILSWEFPLKN